MTIIKVKLTPMKRLQFARFGGVVSIVSGYKRGHYLLLPHNDHDNTHIDHTNYHEKQNKDHNY